MRIGIVTFYSECNYGAFLQALGSKRFLESQGHTVEFINYSPAKDVSLILKLGLHDGTFFRKVARRYKIYIKYRLKSYCGIYLKGFADARAKFFKETEKVSEESLASLADRFDCVYVGSDQVWNMRKSGKEKLFYFLNFFKSGKTKKVSFAACFGQYSQPKSMEEDIKKCLSDFDAISVRNAVSFDLVKKYIGLEAPVVCDPTVLQSDFSFAESDYAATHGLKDYILFYCLDERQKKEHAEMARFLSVKLNKKVISITSSHHTAWTLSAADKEIFDANPMDWLNLFHNADYVYTDSFHGAIFALLYRKNLLMMSKNNERAYRLIDLSKRYGLEQRLCFSVPEAQQKYASEVNYDLVTAKMNEHRDMSREFLLNVLK